MTSDCSITLPSRCETASGETRRVGIELEFSDIEPEQVAGAVATVCGGQITRQTMFDFRVEDTPFGEFTIELDASLLKTAADSIESGILEDLGETAENLANEMLSTTAEQLVPWELVTPPIPMTELDQVVEIVEKLHQYKAQGTRSKAYYAFGTHLNPELPALDARTILCYFKAYLCFYDWIVQEEKIDFARRVTPYINHFDQDYIQKVLDPSYWPELNGFMDDYLEANPTRNRSLDLLPLFCHLDEDRLRKVVDDPRVKPRPTFHYRLPNCDIDNPQWNIHIPWQHWLQVESLAADEDRLQSVCEAYIDFSRGLLQKLTNSWASEVEQWLTSQ